ENDTDQSVQLTWQFNAAYNQAVRNYQVYRRQNVNDAPQLLATLGREHRTYADTSIGQSGYYFFTVVANTVSGEELVSNEYVLHKNLVVVPPAPSGLRGQVITEGGRSYIYLQWNP